MKNEQPKFRKLLPFVSLILGCIFIFVGFSLVIRDTERVFSQIMHTYSIPLVGVGLVLISICLFKSIKHGKLYNAAIYLTGLPALYVLIFTLLIAEKTSLIFITFSLIAFGFTFKAYSEAKKVSSLNES